MKYFRKNKKQVFKKSSYFMRNRSCVETVFYTLDSIGKYKFE